MSTITVSLPPDLQQYVDEQARVKGFGSSSEYIRDVIRKDRERNELRQLLLDAAESPAGPEADNLYFDGLRRQVRQH